MEAYADAPGPVWVGQPARGATSRTSSATLSAAQVRWGELSMTAMDCIFWSCHVRCIGLDFQSVCECMAIHRVIATACQTSQLSQFWSDRGSLFLAQPNSLTSIAHSSACISHPKASLLITMQLNWSEF